MIDRLDGGEIRGYTRAIMDVQAIAKDVNENDLPHHGKRLTPALLAKLLSCILANRESIRERRPGFIRWHNQKHDFEFCTPRAKA